MSKFDSDLNAALSADDKAFLDDLEGGRGLFDQLGATLQGPMRFWSYIVGIFSFVFSWLQFIAVGMLSTRPKRGKRYSGQLVF